MTTALEHDVARVLPKMSASSARKAISRLKRGVVPREWVRFLTVGSSDLIKIFRNDIKKTKSGESPRLFICGERGAGKTHILEYMASFAEQQKLAVSLVTLETQANISFSKAEQLWTAIRMGSRNANVSDIMRYQSYNHVDLISDIRHRLVRKSQEAGLRATVILFDEVVNTLYTPNVRMRFKAYDALHSLIYKETPCAYIVFSVTREFFNRVVLDQFRSNGTYYDRHLLQQTWAESPPPVHSLADLNRNELRTLTQKVISIYSLAFPRFCTKQIDMAKIEQLCSKAAAKSGGQSWLIQTLINYLETVQQSK